VVVDLYRLSAVCSAGVLEVSDQLLLLGVDGTDYLTPYPDEVSRRERLSRLVPRMSSTCFGALSRPLFIQAGGFIWWNRWFPTHPGGNNSYKRLHVAGWSSYPLSSMLPYLATIVVPVLISRDTKTIRSNAPACLGMSYHPAA